MKFKNLQQFFDTFKDEETCRQYLEQQRWNGNVECPYCGCTKVYRAAKRFKCADKFCAKRFSVTVGTIYENTKIGLRTWFAAIYLITSSKKGISSLQLHRQLGISQKTAWFLNHRIREMLKDKAPAMLKCEVQVDETYIGGSEKNKHKSKRTTKKENCYQNAKAPVVGLVEKNGKIVVKSVGWATKKSIGGLIEKHIEQGSTMVTDSHSFYKHLGQETKFVHEIVNHTKEIYVNANGYHTNTIEGFFSIFKRGLYGIYHQVSTKHLQRYCDEFASRYNTKELPDSERFENSVKNCAGRLKYNDLIA